MKKILVILAVLAVLGWMTYLTIAVQPRYSQEAMDMPQLGRILTDALKKLDTNSNLSRGELDALSKLANAVQTSGYRANTLLESVPILSRRVFESPFPFSRLPHEGARIYTTTAQAIPDSTYTELEFDSVTFDDADAFDKFGFVDLDADSTRITIPDGMGGKYLVGVMVQFTSNNNGIRDLRIVYNDSSHIAYDRANAITGLGENLGCVTPYGLSGGDYIEAIVYQNTGGALNTDHAIFWIFRLE